MRRKRLMLAVVPFITAAACSGCTMFNEVYGVMTAGSKAGGFSMNSDKGNDSPNAQGLGLDLPYTLLIEGSGIRFSMYEPDAGCYIGARVQEDRRVGGDIEVFEDLAGKEHALTGMNMKLGGEYPHNKILQCIASYKTPLLTIEPPDGYNPYDEELLKKTAREIGQYNIPIFVDFYPYSKKLGYGAESYRRFYRRAWLTFRELAPNAAIVWSVNYKDIESSYDYYPGDSYTEWVGISITADITGGGNYGEYMENLETFCGRYQTKKPIMITSLSISHFTTLDNTYYTEKCAGELTGFYEYIRQRWPRVKAIVYNNYSTVGNGGKAGTGKANYLITDEELIIAAYSAAISNPAFLSSISDAKNQKDEPAPQLIKSGYNAVYQNGSFYVEAESAADIIPGASQSLTLKVISGKSFYSLDDVSATLGGSLHVDGENHIVYLKN